ncbi:MAG: ATP-binding protein [Nannocystaceae bacterium]
MATCYIARSFFDNVIGLEKIVQTRTAELDGRNRDMRLVLNNVDQGFLTIDLAGKMTSEHSAILGEWFGLPSEGQAVAGYLDRSAKGFAEAFENAWGQVLDDIMPLELNLAQMPSELVHDGRECEIHYRPIMKEGKLDRVLMVISDVTAERERQRLEAEQRETLNVLDRIVSDRSGFTEFMHEAGDLVDSICSGSLTETRTMARAIHTLKGNTMIFGVQSVADICHDIETRLSEDGKICQEHTRPLQERWGRFKATLDKVLGEQGDHRIEIERSQFEELLAAVLSGDDHAQLATLVSDLRLEPTGGRLKRVAEQAERMARRLGKGDVDIEIDDQMLRLEPARWHSFWSSFVHVVPNAVDHGLETPGQRRSIGKDSPARLGLRTYVDGREFVIELRDNGRGVDWEKVKERAAAKGMPVSSKADLEEAIFQEGVSTKDEVSEISGRGVGLGAVRTACIERDGSVSVVSEAGSGTTFAFRFPRDSMGPTPQEMLAAA